MFNGNSVALFAAAAPVTQVEQLDLYTEVLNTSGPVCSIYQEDFVFAHLDHRVPSVLENMYIFSVNR